jgi:hypothetical protein
VAEYGLYLNIGTIVALVGGVASIVWKLSRVEKEIRDDMDAQIDNLQRDVQGLTRDSLGRTETLRHETGEMGSAIRQKIHDVEMFTRDTFVRKDTFEAVMNRIEKSIEKLGDRLEEKIDKMKE